MPLSQTIIDRALQTPQGERAYGVCEILLDAGYEAWWVGGCVRDMFLEEVPDDIDIATNAEPAVISSLFPKSDDTSAKLGSVIVSHKGETFEVTTFREDADASNGRKPESVVFTTREKDASRRDITINSLYWNPITSELFDPYDGEKDLNEKLIRIIGDPVIRISHDALRLLRVIRFRALVEGQYHPDTFIALHEKSKDIIILSGERRFKELQKMLIGPHPELAFEDLWETDILEHLIPELHACKGVAQPSEYHGIHDVWEHILSVLSSFTFDHEVDVRWAALFHDIGKPPTFTIEEDRIHFNDHASAGADMTRNILKRLQCPKKRIGKISWLIDHHMTMMTFTSLDNDRKAHWYYHPWFIELLQLFWLDASGINNPDFSLYDEIISDYNQYLDSHPLPPKPLLDGHDVMEILGIKPGEKIGEILHKLYAEQIAGNIKNKEDAKKYLESL
ncbi:MAG: CCA tRNA nucleotidyltransferase [Candidatus Peribacteraceae bacterium]|nr:CCA tRNA nucleotidyltransferase [Candidatus Peribacteraceae bacterium]